LALRVDSDDGVYRKLISPALRRVMNPSAPKGTRVYLWRGLQAVICTTATDHCTFAPGKEAKPAKTTSQNPQRHRC
jgi:hypothetical protein